MRREKMSIGSLTVNECSLQGDALLAHAAGERIYLNGALGSNGNSGKFKGEPIASLLQAQRMLRSGYNDIIYFQASTGGIALGAAFDWDDNLAHLVGVWPGYCEHARCILGMSTTFTPFMTVSGYGNSFSNIYTTHGTAAGDYVGWLISGARNNFRNVHFGGPFFAAQADHANYRGVNITATENVFDGCIFGDTSITRDAANYNVSLAAGVTAHFKNCLFRMYVDGANSMFVNFANTAGITLAYFENCTFLALSANLATTIDEALHFDGGSTALAVLDSDCNFIKVTKIAHADKDQYVYLARPHVTTTVNEGQIAEVLVS